MALSDDVFGPTEGSNREDRGSGVSDDASNFCGSTNMIFGIGGGDKVIDRVTRGGDRDDKSCIFKDDNDNGVGAKDELQFQWQSSRWIFGT